MICCFCRVTTEMLAAFDRASVALVISLDADSMRNELAAKGVSEASMEYESKLLFIDKCESVFRTIQSMGFKYLIISCSQWAKALSDPMVCSLHPSMSNALTHKVAVRQVLANKAGLVTEERPFSTMLPSPLLRKPLLCTTHFIRSLRGHAYRRCYIIFVSSTVPTADTRSPSHLPPSLSPSPQRARYSLRWQCCRAARMQMPCCPSCYRR